jgi:thiol-disulfide isomerase/thioredoxin
MSATPSTMLELGTPVSDFELPDVVSGQTVSLSDFDDKKGIIIIFMCNHCPYVKLIKEKLTEIAREFSEQIGTIAINPNDIDQKPQDGPEAMIADAEKFNYPFPYLLDQSQQTAKAYRAACTPDLYLVDSNHHLVYRGQFDSSRPGNDIPVTGDDLKEAIFRLIEDKNPLEEQTPSIGCNIKWKPGNEPDYFG